MQEESRALLAFIEGPPEAPIWARRTMLEAVKRNVVYLAEEDRRRFDRLLSAQRHERPA